MAADTNFIEALARANSFNARRRTMTRKMANRILEAVAEGSLSAQTVLECCLEYMNDDEVADMANVNHFFSHEEEDDTMDAVEETYGEDDLIQMALGYSE